MHRLLALGLCVAGTVSPDESDPLEEMGKIVVSNYSETDNIESWLDQQPTDLRFWVSSISSSWSGTGQGLLDDGPWTERLIITSILRRKGPTGPAALYEAIREKMPDSKFEPKNLFEFLHRLKDMTRMPALFHQAIVERLRQRKSMRKDEADTLANELAPFLPATEYPNVWRVNGGTRIWNWIHLCINLVESGFCEPLSTGPVPYWILTAPAIEKFLKDYEEVLISKVRGPSPNLPTSSIRA